MTHPVLCEARYSSSSDRLARGGDRDELSSVFGSQRGRLFLAALRILGNSEDAEDAVQDGLLSALRNLHRFEGRCHMSTWLTRIVLNAALMRLRSLRAHRSPTDGLSQESDYPQLIDRLVATHPNPEETFLRTERLQMLNQGLQSLSRHQRQALSLYHLQGMTMKETASVLGISEGTVKSQIHRGRQRLSQQMRSIEETRPLANLGRSE